MEWIGVAFVVSLAYVYAPLLRVHAARKLGLALPVAEHQAAAAAVLPPAQPAQVPTAVLRFIEQESEPWAREQLLEHARALYAETGDWSVVMQRLDA